MSRRRQQLRGTAQLAPRCRGRADSDTGFTLVEIIITMLVLTVVFGITMGLIIGLRQQQVNLSATVAGANQSELASQEVVQYLRAASSPPSGAIETPSSFSFPAYIGASSGLLPESVTITATYTAGVVGPTGTGTLAITFTGQPVSGPVLTRKVATYFVLAPTSAATPIFTYYEYATGGTPGTLQAISMTGSPLQMENACLGDIVAVKVDASFFAGPQDTPTRGYAADTATTIQTTVYLRNSSLVYGSTTTAPPSPTLPPAVPC